MLLIANHKPLKVDSALQISMNIYGLRKWTSCPGPDGSSRQVSSRHGSSRCGSSHTSVSTRATGPVSTVLHFCTLVQPISELLHFCTVDSLFFNQSENFYTFALFLSQSVSYYTFLHCLHVQGNIFQHYLAFILLLLMQLNNRP